MKYCSKCKKVYPDGIDCECTTEKRFSWEDPVSMVDLDCEAKCDCGSKVDLTYFPLYKFHLASLKDLPAYCRCATCQKKLDNERNRQESMKYLVLDGYQGEDKFCDNTDEVEEFLKYYTDEVEEFLKYYTEDSDRDSGMLDGVLILKLEPLNGELKESDFIPQREYVEGGYQNRQEPNTHIVIYEGEKYRIEQVMVPELEYDGGRSINW